MSSKKNCKKRKTEELREQDLGRWKLIEDFQARLARAAQARPKGEVPRTESDPRRLLAAQDYLSLLLFGLFNPVVHSMRGLCAASRLGRVQSEVSSHRVSLGSFSEAQAVIDPVLLEKVFGELASEEQQAAHLQGDARLGKYQAARSAVDGTLWRALPRMTWAAWRHQGKPQSALKLHLKFNVLGKIPTQAVLTPGKKCERAVLRQHLRAGEFYVADRSFGEDYALFEELAARGCSYVIGLRQEATWEVEKELPLSEADRAAGVLSDRLVRLGARHKTGPLRLVRVATEKGPLFLLTDKSAAELSAELIALIYRYRWQIELFFKWFKCILGCRHWLAESPRGVALQIYCALIAALLLLRYGGSRPNKRAMEMIRFYLLGYATLDELCAQLGVEKKKA